MFRIPPRLTILIAGAAVSLVAIACDPLGDVEEPPWGDEAVSYFTARSAAYSANDFYGVLDFYANDAFHERWRGADRGGALVRDLLIWNSGDLGHEILHVYIGPRGAALLIRWERAGGLSVIEATIDDGLTTGEVAYDHSAWLEAGLRSSPELIARYENLYETHIKALGETSGISDLYAPDAVLLETLDGEQVTEFSGIVPGGPPINAATALELTQTVNRVTVSGPAVFLGPSDYAVDPERAVAIVDVTDESGCTRQIAVRWRLADGQIVEESHYEEVEGFRKCRSEIERTGWWTNLEMPRPRDEAVSGVVSTPAGNEVAIHNGSPPLEDLLLEGLERFAQAGLDEPRFDSVTFEPSRHCAEHAGRLLQDADSRQLFLCFFGDDLCPVQPTCTTLPLTVRSSVLHELAHAWLLDYVGTDKQTRLLQATGREVWQDNTVPWPERGVEYAAEVITWGLLEETAPMVRIGSPSCLELHTSYELLTDSSSLRDGSECPDG